MFVFLHEFPLTQDMALHGLDQICFSGGLGQIQQGIQGLDFEVVAMGATGWGGAAVAGASKVGDALAGTVR